MALTEYPADFALQSGSTFHLIHRSGRYLGPVTTKPKESILLTDRVQLLAPGNTLFGEEEKKNILAEIGNLREKNTSGLAFASLSATDPKNLSMTLDSWTVLLGDGQNLKEKLNKAINTIKSAKAQGVPSAQVDVRYNSNPIIKPKEASNGTTVNPNQTSTSPSTNP